MSATNHVVMKWARERLNLSIQDVARVLKKEPRVIQEWELGISQPNYSTLEKLAYSIYNLPLAVFYFPDPPQLPDIKRKFRLLPDFEFERFSSDTIKKIQLGLGYQDSLTALQPSKNARDFLTFLKPFRADIQKLANMVRTIIEVTIEDQCSCASAEAALKKYRHSLESVGIFLFKDTFRDRFVCGLSLLDIDHPIILINNSTSFTRQLFTLAHELAHIIFEVGGATVIEDDYLSFLSDEERSIESNCNAFAAEFLLPESTFRKDLEDLQSNWESKIGFVAEKYCVSREVILRRLFNNGLISRQDYKAFSEQFNKEYLRGSKGSGGNYYSTRLSYLGEGYAKLAFSRYFQNQISFSDLSGHLNMSAKSVKSLGDRLGF